MASAADMALLRNVRREFGKTPLDTTRMELGLIKGVHYCSGAVSALKEGGEDGGVIRVKNEMADILFRISKMQGVKQVVNGCKMIEPKPKILHNAPTSL